MRYLMISNRIVSSFLLLAIFAFKATNATNENDAKEKSSLDRPPPHLSYTQFKSILSFNDDELFGQQEQHQSDSDELLSTMNTDDLWNNMMSTANTKNQQEDAKHTTSLSLLSSSSESVSSSTTNNNDTNNLQNITKNNNTMLFPFIVCHLDYESSLCGTQRHEIINSVLVNKSNSSSDFFLDKLPLFNYNYDETVMYTKKETDKDEREPTKTDHREKDDKKAYGACFYASMNLALTESITKDDDIVITPLASALKIRRDHSHRNVKNEKYVKDNTDSVDNKTIAIAVRVAPGMVKSELEVMDLANELIDTEGDRKDELLSKLAGACEDNFLSLLSVAVTGLTSFSYEVQRRRRSTQNITHECYRSFVEYLSLQREIQSIERVPKIVVSGDITNWILQSGDEKKNPWIDLGITGKGETIQVADTGLDLNHCYFRDASGQVPLTTDFNVIGKIDHNKRKVVQHVALEYFGDGVDNYGGHGSYVVGTLLGKRSDDGRVEVDGMADGVAPGAKVALFDANDCGDDCSDGGAALSISIPLDLFMFFYYGNMASARISNASWGKYVNGQYVDQSRDVDEYFYEDDKMLMVAAAGNTGEDGSATINSPAVSKNVLAIGASHSYGKNLHDDMRDFNYVASFSSRGPTGDGRIKPDLIAPGHSVLSVNANSNECDPLERPQYDPNEKQHAGLVFKSGTSMSCPAAAGAGALVRQYFKEIYWPPMDISGTLLKAVLINGAQPLKGRAASLYGEDGYNASVPYDEFQAFGMINLMKSLKHPKIDDSPDIYVKDRLVLQQGEIHEYKFYVCDDREFRVTIVWNDPPGEPGCEHCLINDLDLEVEYDGDTYYPNGRENRDDKNNVERVVLSDDLIASDVNSVVYVTVKGRNIGYENDKSQKYSLASTGCIIEVESTEERFFLQFNISYPTESYLDVVAISDETKIVENVVRHFFSRSIPFSRLRVLHHYTLDSYCTIVFEVTSDLYACDDLCTKDKFAPLVANALTDSLDKDTFLEALKDQSIFIDTFSNLSQSDIVIELDFESDATISPTISNEPTPESSVSKILQCESDEFQYYIEITTDRKPEQTSWKFEYENGMNIEKSSEGDYELRLHTYKHYGCARYSCYRFTIVDKDGNGLCCDKGVGSYIVYAEEEAKASGAKFGLSETTRFCHNPESIEPTTTSSPSVSIHPTQAPSMIPTIYESPESLVEIVLNGISGIMRQIHTVFLSFSWLLQEQKAIILQWIIPKDERLNRDSPFHKRYRESNKSKLKAQKQIENQEFYSLSDSMDLITHNKDTTHSSSDLPHHLSYTQFRSILSFNDEHLQHQYQESQEGLASFMDTDDIWNNMISNSWISAQQTDTHESTHTITTFSSSTTVNENHTNLQNTSQTKMLLHPFIVCHLDNESSLCGSQRHDYINSVFLNKSNSTTDFFLDELPIFNQNLDKDQNIDDKKAYGACFYVSMKLELAHNITKDDDIVLTPLASALKIRQLHFNWKDIDSDAVDNYTDAITVSLAPGMVKSELEVMELAHDLIDTEGDRKDELLSTLSISCDDNFISLLSVVVTGLNSFSYDIKKRRTSTASSHHITHECYRSFVEYLSVQREIISIERVPRTVLLNDITSWILQSGERDKKPWSDIWLSGSGETVQVLDTGLDENSCYFRDASGQVPLTTNYNATSYVDHNKRKVVQYVALQGIGNGFDNSAGHGSHTVGTLLGKRSDDGRVEVDGMADGVAYGAKVAFFDAHIYYEDETLKSLDIGGLDMRKLFSYAEESGSRIHSASWGGERKTYTSRASIVDEYLHEFTDFAMFVAAGNRGENGASTIDDPAFSKNVISVGASHGYGKNLHDDMRDFNYVAWFSSRGPTFDGRIKPDLIAPGHSVLSVNANSNECDPSERPQYDPDRKQHAGLVFKSGTSMSCPAAAGAGALVRQYFKEIYWPPMDISGTLLKAVLINGAQPLKGRAASLYGEDGYNVSVPYDGFQAFGMINLMKSLKHPKIDDSPDIYVKDLLSISQDEVHRYNFDVCDDHEFRVTLVWNDPPGTVGCEHCLINDLDLEVEYDGDTYYPNGRDNRDDKNNVERVVLSEDLLSDDVNSVVSVTVRGRNIGIDIYKSQKYSLASTGCINEVLSSVETVSLSLNVSYPTATYPDAVAMFDEATAVKDSLKTVFRGDKFISRLDIEHQYILSSSCTLVFSVTSKAYSCDSLCNENEIKEDFSYKIGNLLEEAYYNDDLVDILKKEGVFMDALKNISTSDIDIEFGFSFERGTLSPTTLSPTTMRPTSVPSQSQYPSISPSTSTSSPVSFSCDTESEYTIEVSIDDDSDCETYEPYWTLENYDNQEIVESYTNETNTLSSSDWRFVRSCVQEGCFLFTIERESFFHWEPLNYCIKIENKTVAEGRVPLFRKKREYFCYYDISDDGNLVQEGIPIILAEIKNILLKILALLENLLEYFANATISGVISDLYSSMSSWIISVFCNSPTPPSPSEFQCDILIDTDIYPEETKWELSYQNGTLVDSVKYDYDTGISTEYGYSYNVTSGCYNFTLWDLADDGGPYFRISVEGSDNYIGGGGDFGSNETKLFCYDGETFFELCEESRFLYSVLITTDGFPWETSWKLSYDDGTLIKSVDEGYYENSYKEYVHSSCLPAGCLSFTIYDSYGDGNVGYMLRVDGEVAIEGGNFGYEVTKEFCYDGAEITLS